MTVRLTEALSIISDKAKLDGMSPPVIQTDLLTAMELRWLINQELGGFLPRQDDCIAMFDGVKIVAAPQPDAKWREHFGILADIWSA
jgi:hypothetical protein